ncbi:hypothetical protein POM88_039806 [Heracleum sosnowskyi]|uniref:Leucine-rich repeat-containing N-terminal plant-type domain-containing protein n=1 Tax=Heracleum sosnowskyi TaxID=360622 RepID=A0AAD8M6R9_9APIA|nr:hypothetical protein POM88_039806 [Heracleum sosnowskyi]
MVSIQKSNEIRYLHYLLVFTFLLSAASELASQNSTKMMVRARCTETEKQALLDIKRSLVDTNGRLSSWGNSHDDENCCQWSGVGCDLHTGHVTHLNISYLNYFDQDHPRSQSISNISHSLIYLRNLQYLDLSCNIFSIPVPSFIGSLTNLVHLDLSGADFQGAIPDEIGNLSKLNHLDLSSNSFGSSPIPKFIASFSSLTYLDLSDNQFSGALPDQLSNLSKLHYLDLSYNMLQGRIPNSFGVMIGITYLNLSANHLKGVLPNSLYYLSKLRTVDFSHNNLTGNLQDLLYLLPRATLQKLWISENQLTGSLPDITRFPFLKELKVDSNQLNGYLPKVFEHKSVLQSLELSHNNLQGSLPNFTRFSFLENLDLSGNKFSGSLPDFTGCTSLKNLLLGGNKFTTWETQSIGKLANLHQLNLSRNSINSTISEYHLCKLYNIKLMDASFNSITFNMSSEWLPPCNLQELFLASCHLGPLFPKWIQNQTDIIGLDFSNTQILDTIPLWFWDMSTRMQRLDLSSNKIKGSFSSIPLSIEEIDLSSNNFEGQVPPIPPQSSKIDLSHNKFSGNLLPMSKVEGTTLSFLDLSHNSLFEWIGQNLTQLYALILKSNHFYGSMPYDLCHLSNLRFLDLSKNSISGNVPQCFSNLTAMIENTTGITDHYYTATYGINFRQAIFSYFDDAFAGWKGKERECGTIGDKKTFCSEGQIYAFLTTFIADIEGDYLIQFHNSAWATRILAVSVMMHPVHEQQNLNRLNHIMKLPKRTLFRAIAYVMNCI